MKKDIEKNLSVQWGVASGVVNNRFKKQIGLMKPGKLLDIPLDTQQIASSLQDTDDYIRLPISNASSRYNKLLGYCALFKGKKNNLLQLRPVYLSVPGGSSSPLRDKLRDYLQEEVYEDPNIQRYIISNLGRRAIIESHLRNNIFAAVEFGTTTTQVTSAESEFGATIVVPRSLLDTVPRLAGSEMALSRIRSSKPEQFDYYQKAVDLNTTISSTRSLVLSGLLNSTNSVKY